MQTIQQPTPAKHYSVCMDSVNLLAELKVATQTTDVIDAITRNKEHLRIMLAKDFWTTEDLTPLRNAIL